MSDGMVDCPGCLREFNTVEMNGAFVRVEIDRMSLGVCTSTNFYCPACSRKLQMLKSDQLMDTMEVVVRGVLKGMK